MTYVFHEIPQDVSDIVLRRGLLQQKGGDKTDDTIRKTDAFLNHYRPEQLKQLGLDREINNYCYVAKDNHIIDITSGKELSVTEFIKASSQALLQMDIDSSMCYVSNLDLYDQVMKLLQCGDGTNATRLAHVYWDTLPVLKDYRGDFRRPEVVVPYDIPASAITRLA